MASLKFLAVIHNIGLLLFLIQVVPTTTLSQTMGNSPPGPSIAECALYLMPLASCGPFVQGTVPLPSLQCCTNLMQVYSQRASCLCSLLNGSIPINTTLALQLPIRCSMQIDTSICSAPSAPTSPSLPPIAPTSQVSTGTRSNSTIAASPVVTVEPRIPGLIGFGSQHSSGANINVKDYLKVAILTLVFNVLGLSTVVTCY